MKRRDFCLRILPGVILSRKLLAAGQDVAAKNFTEEDYAIWSLLIPAMQSDPGAGYLVAAAVAAPDAYPFPSTGTPKAPIEKAREAAVGAVSYETSVPDDFSEVFLDALSKTDSVGMTIGSITASLHLPKRYRLLLPTQVKAYLDLSPSAVPSGWHPDTKVSLEFKGWNEITFLSRPVFDASRQFAMVWSQTGPNCWSSQWSFYARAGHRWEQKLWVSESHTVCT